MSWWEWALWLHERRQELRRCARTGHDIRDEPELCADRVYRWRCRRCPYRFRADRVITGSSTETAPDQGMNGAPDHDA